MARRFFSVLLICVLVTLPSTGGLSAQDASPVPVESAPSEIPTIGQPAQPADDLAAAEAVGNTPAGFYSDDQIYVREDVYFNIFQVTVGGQTDIVDGTDGRGVFDAPGYRADNAKIVTLWTTAEYVGNFHLCVIFEESRFANPSAVELLRLDGAIWTALTPNREGNTICAYTQALGVFAVAEPGSPPSTATETSVPATSTMTASGTITSTPSATPTSSPSATGTASQTATSTSNPIQFALPNVYITYPQTPVVGDTNGEERAASSMPSLPATYIASNAWFFSVSSTVSQTGNKRLCVVFETAPYTDPHMLTLVRWTGSGWAPLSGTILDSLLADEGTICGYTSAFGDFALVERATATATASRTPSRTASPTWTPSSTGTASVTRTPIPSASATVTPSTTPSPSSSTTSTHVATATATSSPTATSTATLAPGSYATGTLLRTTTRVNLRSAFSTSSPSLGVLASGATVTVIGSTVSASGLNWVPVSSALGDGWIAGSYLAVVPTVTPTRTPAPPTMTRTSGPSTATRTATRPAGGFIAGDAVRTTSNVNLRAAPSSSATILQVVPSKTEAIVTGPGVVSSGITFYPVTISGYPAGYLAGSYLQRISATATPSPTRTPTATVVGSTVRYTTDTVNLRKGPGTNYGKVATLPEGTRVNITGAARKVNGVTWYPIIVNNVGSGWVSGAFLTTLPPL